MPEGISQVLFLVDERFMAVEISTFKSFEKEILNSDIAEYTTFVRTKFGNFKIKKECDEDKDQVFYESEAIAKIVKLCKDDDDKERVRNNKRTRARPRNILLNHLETTCQEKYYKLTTWDELYNKIASVKLNGTGDIAEEVKRSLIIESEKKNEKTQQTKKRKGRKNQKDQQWFDEKYSNEEVINIVGRKRLNLADISSCTELEFLDCSTSKLTSLGINNCKFLLKEYGQNGTKSNRFKYPPDLKIIEKRITKNFNNSWPYWWCFSVVDTIGVGDTRLFTKKVLYKILDGIFSIPEGISQILFVIDERFTTEEEKIFNLLKGSIFDIFEIRMLDYVTIVRTKFSNFKNKNECEADKKRLYNEHENIAKIVKSCRDIVYVDNPPTNIQIFDEDDQETVATNRRKRERPREILLNYLDKTCQLDYFKLKMWMRYVMMLPNI
ncbi:hypothetical protein RhiirA4_529849 [Rhizophagus irregularis]|uniref:Uncharacterized protein n=1 Tax=Rhizophagus irregularis TaxID=588596 RepID=A0A2I1GUF8_9GLOM|nr:hypothetical protein RhiirA4_529849 [Rhizophagus irregularis]